MYVKEAGNNYTYTRITNHITPFVQQTNEANMPDLQKSRNIRVIMLKTTLAIGVLFGLIMFVLQVNNSSSGLKSSFSLTDIVNNKYIAERWNGTWISDVEYAYLNQHSDLAIFR